MSFNDRSFGWAQLAYMLLVTVAALIWPGAGFWTTVSSLMGVWIVVSLLYQYTRYRNSAGWWTLLAATTALSIGVIVNVWYFTTASGVTVSDPVLNNYDARDYFDSSMAVFSDAEAQPTHHRMAIARFIAQIWDITGVSIFSPIVVNMTMVLAAVIVSGLISERMLRGVTGRSPQWVTTCAMIMTAGVCYYLNSGTVLLKDAAVAMAMALCVFGLTGIPHPFADRCNRGLAVGCFCVGILLLAMARFQYIWIVVAGIFVLTLFAGGRRWGFPSVLLALCGVAWLLVERNVATAVDAGTIMSDALEGPIMRSAWFFGDIPGHEFYERYVNNSYFYWPVWKKLLWLPVSAVTQYLIPFPWNYIRDTNFGPTLAYAHFAYPWYAVGSLVLYFIGGCIRRAPRELTAWTAWAVMAWLLPAYMVAGTVSRYGLPFLPMLVPAAVYVAAQCTRLKSWRAWTAIYAVALAVTLIVSHHLQSSAI